MYNYNSMVNAFFKLDGHMFCLDSFAFLLLAVCKKYLITRITFKDFKAM